MLEKTVHSGKSDYIVVNQIQRNEVKKYEEGAPRILVHVL
jgi:hypothetical protein